MGHVIKISEKSSSSLKQRGHFDGRIGICGLNSCGSGQRPVVFCRESSDEPSSSIIFGEFLD